MRLHTMLLIMLFLVILAFEPSEARARLLSPEDPCTTPPPPGAILFYCLKVQMYALAPNGEKRSNLCNYPDDMYNHVYGCGTEYPDQDIQAADGSYYVREPYYLKNVLAAEMDVNGLPPDIDALKAQAIASRTVATWKSKHGPWDIGGYPNINNSIQYQAFIPGAYNASGAQSMIDTAIADTDQQFLQYVIGDDHAIDAEFSSDIVGSTVDAGDAFPYLETVSEPISPTLPATCGPGELGNGWGMSQKGAMRWSRGNQCAKSSAGDMPWSVTWDYRQILVHYYTGIDILNGDGSPSAPDARHPA